jgi:uncharacterized protein YjcR
MGEEHTYPTIRQAMDSADIAEYCGVSADTVKAWRRTNRLPEPAAVFGGRLPVWEFRTIEKWNAQRPGRGRPPST